MQRWFAALIVAVVLAIGVTQPAGAQTCADFASQKEAQLSLEQNGDVSGALDPDLNGYACEGVAFDATGAATLTQDVPAGEVTVDQAEAVSGQTTIDDSGPTTGDDASGESGVSTTISQDDGAEEATSDDGSANTTGVEGTEGEVAADDAAATDDGDGSAAAAGDAAAASDETGDVAAAGDAVAVNENEAGGEAQPQSGQPVSLPRTGVGSTSGTPAGSIALALVAVLAGLAMVGVRRVQQG